MPPDSAAVRLRTLAVDDEPLARRNLTVLLRRDPDIVTVDECGSGAEAIAQIRSSRPDLVFLDVQMPECNGFDVLELLGSDQPRAINFKTAQDNKTQHTNKTNTHNNKQKPNTKARFE